MTELTTGEALLFIIGVIFVAVILPVLMKILLDRELNKKTGD